MHILNSFQSCVNTMGKSSDPCSCLAIHGSHCWFISGVKWFCQSPTWPFLINCLPFLAGISFSLLTYLRRLLLITNVQQLLNLARTGNFPLHHRIATCDQKLTNDGLMIGQIWPNLVQKSVKNLTYFCGMTRCRHVAKSYPSDCQSLFCP